MDFTVHTYLVYCFPIVFHQLHDKSIFLHFLYLHLRNSMKLITSKLVACSAEKTTVTQNTVRVKCQITSVFLAFPVLQFHIAI